MIRASPTVLKELGSSDKMEGSLLDLVMKGIVDLGTSLHDQMGSQTRLIME